METESRTATRAELCCASADGEGGPRLAAVNELAEITEPEDIDHAEVSD